MRITREREKRRRESIKTFHFVRKKKKKEQSAGLSAREGEESALRITTVRRASL